MHDISGFLILVQIWAWYRFPHIALRRLLRQPIADSSLITRWWDAFIVREISIHVVWRPYNTELIEGLPPYCSDGVAIWQAVVTLICFFIVKMHHLDRTIPYNCDTVIALHNLDLHGTKTKDWVNHHKEWIQLWDQCRTHIVICEPWDGNMHGDDSHIVWYRCITRRYISHAACTFDFVSGHLVQTCNASLEGSHIGTLIRQALAALHEQDCFTKVPLPQPDVHAHAEAEPSDRVDSEPHVERDFTFIPNLRSMLNDWCQTPIRMEDFGNAMAEQHEEGSHILRRVFLMQQQGFYILETD
ncbi:hypothetical protein ACSBR2_014839 [Camellia fascicularis]